MVDSWIVKWDSLGLVIVIELQYLVGSTLALYKSPWPCFVTRRSRSKERPSSTMNAPVIDRA